MQGPSKALEDRLEGAAEPGWSAMPKACSDALAAERQVWRLHSEISELALLTHRLLMAPEVRGEHATTRELSCVHFTSPVENLRDGGQVLAAKQA